MKNDTECEEQLHEVYLEGKFVGHYTSEVPKDWDYKMRYFHKNEGSWCSNNMQDIGKLELFDGCEIPFDPDNGSCFLCGKVEIITIMLKEEENEEVGNRQKKMEPRSWWKLTAQQTGKDVLSGLPGKKFGS